MDVDAVVVQGTWWRHTPHGGDPLFRGDPPSDGRWQKGSVRWTLAAAVEH